MNSSQNFKKRIYELRMSRKYQKQEIEKIIFLIKYFAKQHHKTIHVKDEELYRRIDGNLNHQALMEGSHDLSRFYQKALNTIEAIEAYDAFLKQ